MSTEPATVFRSELSSLRDHLLRSIDGQLLGDVDDGLRLYTRLVDRLFALRSEYRERLGVAAPGTWTNALGQEMTWLEDDLATLLDRAWATNNPGVIEKFTSATVSLLNALREARQPDAHQRVLDLAARSYRRSLASGQDPDDRRAVGRSLLIAIRSYGQFQILHDNRSDESQRLLYLTQVSSLLVRCAKLALDHNPSRFSGALIEIRELTDWTGERHDRWSEEWSDSPVAAFERYLAGFVLGLGGYVIMLREHGQMSDETAATLLSEILDQFQHVSTWISLQSAVNDLGESYPWSQWEMQHWPDGQTGGAIGVLLDRIRVAALVRMTLRNESTGPTDLDGDIDSRTGDYLIRSILEAIDHTDLSWFVSETELEQSAIDDTNAKLQALMETYRERLEDERGAFPLMSPKIERFESRIEEIWLETHPLRGALVATEDETETSSAWFGYDGLQSKSWFTDSDVHAEPERLGESLGRGLVRGEIESSLRILSGASESTSSLTSLRKSVSRELARIRSLGGHPQIFVVGSWRASRELADGQWSLRGVQQTFEDALLAIEHGRVKPGVYVADLASALLIRRWLVPEDSDHCHNLAHSRLRSCVHDIDVEYAGELIGRNPDLRRDEDGRYLSKDEAIRRLLRLVHVRLQTKFEVAGNDLSFASVVRLDDGHDLT